MKHEHANKIASILVAAGATSLIAAGVFAVCYVLHLNYWRVMGNAFICLIFFRQYYFLKDK